MLIPSKDSIQEGRRLEIPTLLLTGRSEAVVGEKLTLKQELFCYYYTQNPETLLNATLSYAEAYGFDLESMSHEGRYVIKENKEKDYIKSEFERYEHYCGVAASRMMRNDRISRRITDLFNETMRDELVDMELMKIIRGNSKNSDKIAAIKEYNALKQRITKKLDLSTLGKSINSEDKGKIKSALLGIFGNSTQNA